MQAIYTTTGGDVLAHISITALTEHDVDLMDAIESTLCRYARRPHHPSEEEAILDTARDPRRVTR